MRLSELVANLDVAWLRTGDTEIDRVTIDHREVLPGTLFVARRGYFGDAHRHVPQVLRDGVAALIVGDPATVPQEVAVPVLYAPFEDPLLGELSARFYGHPTRSLQVFGVTGTNGKTSVTFILEHLLRTLGERPAVMGTVTYRCGRWARPAANTTPDALFLHRFARQALDAGATALVLEVSSHALALGRHVGVEFDSVGFTNLTPEHLDFHPDMDAYRAAKQQLFDDVLRTSAAAGKRVHAAAVLDDPAGEGMLRATPPTAGRYGVRVGAYAGATQPGGRNLRVTRLESLGVRGSRVRISHDGEGPAAEVVVPLVGAYNLANVGLALAMLLGPRPEAFDTAVAALARFDGVPGRLEPALDAAATGVGVFVDYAHSTDAVERVLDVACELAAGPVTAVVGCGGDRDPTKRGPMARAAAERAARVVLTSDNPRSENPERILDAMEAGIPPTTSANVVRQVDRSSAIAAAMAHAGQGPVVIAGKGHETYQEVAGVRYALDDREEARRAWVAHQAGIGHDAVPLLAGWSAERVAHALSAQLSPTPPRLPWCRIEGRTAAGEGLDVPLLEPALGLTLQLGDGGGERVASCLVDPELALVLLARAVVSEARHRRPPLWVLESPPEEATGTADLLAATYGADQVVHVTRPAELGRAVRLAPRHRVLVVTPDVLPDVERDLVAESVDWVRTRVASGAIAELVEHALARHRAAPQGTLGVPVAADAEIVPGWSQKP